MGRVVLGWKITESNHIWACGDCSFATQPSNSRFIARRRLNRHLRRSHRLPKIAPWSPMVEPPLVCRNDALWGTDADGYLLPRESPITVESMAAYFLAEKNARYGHAPR